jgi:hypothetical protein
MAFQASTSPSQEFNLRAKESDPRLLRLQEFFEEKDSPAADLAGEFVEAADRYHLDWRLLPSIAFVESGGGKAAQNNNLFGWDDGKCPFPSIRYGIGMVASRLRNSKLYKDKSLDEILMVYNPNSGYPAMVKMVMAEVGPADLLTREMPGSSAYYSSMRMPK